MYQVGLHTQDANSNFSHKENEYKRQYDNVAQDVRDGVLTPKQGVSEIKALQKKWGQS